MIARGLEAKLEIVAAGGVVETAGDQALELAHGDAGTGGELTWWQRLVEMRLHVGHDAGDTPVDRGDMTADRDPLRLEARALALVDQAGTDDLGQVVTMLGADQLEDQIERGDTAGAGQPVAIA